MVSSKTSSSVASSSSSRANAKARRAICIVPACAFRPKVVHFRSGAHAISRRRRLATIIRSSSVTRALPMRRLRSVKSLLDVAGEGAQNVTKRLHDRLMASVTNWQLTGESDGVARTDITLEQPAQRVGLTLVGDGLQIALADDDSALSTAD